MRFRWPWIFAPLGLGLAAGLLIHFTSLNDPLIFVQIQFSLLVVGISGLVSLVLGGLFLQDRRDHKLVNYAEEEFSQDRRRFLQRLDHELKNPLTAILAGLANLSLQQDHQDRQTTLESVKAQVNRMRQLVGELRKLADLEIRPLDFSTVDLSPLLEETFQLIQGQDGADQRELSLTLPHAPWPLPAVSGDPDLLSLAFHNLLSNALKFSQAGDTIELRALEDGSQVVIEIADTGPGIPSSESEHIWEELYRGENARGIPGSGLGLALVKAVISRHQGEISVRTRSGEGTVFTVRLPIQR